MIIYAYDSNISSEAIIQLTYMLNDINILQKFFNNINIKPNGGHSWFQVWLGHNNSEANILADIKILVFSTR